MPGDTQLATVATRAAAQRPVPYRRIEEGGHARHLIARGSMLAVLIVLAVVMIYPFVWMILTSLRPNNTVFNGPIIPTRLVFGAYSAAWNQIQFGAHFLNSVLVTVVTVLATLVLSTLSGYAFAKLEFRFKQVIYFGLLSTLMMPASALIIPLYLQLKSLQLLDSRAGLVLLYVGSATPFAMFLMRAFFETLPDELVQAARVDGAGELTVFARVMLPLARPGIATVVIFQFLSTWNEFLYANTVIQTTGKLPLQPVLFTLVGQYATNWPVLTAALTMSIVPILIVYVRMQQQFVAGMTLGAVKN